MMLHLPKLLNLSKMNQLQFFKKTTISLIVMGLAGCSSMGSGSAQWGIPTTSKQIAEAKTRTQTLAESGTDYLVKGELEKAQQVFNTALKFDIKSVPLHFFNALTYQIKHEKGDPEAFKLAEAGYNTALKLDPSLDIAFMQLGHLYMSVNNYAAAQKNYVMATPAPTRQRNRSTLWPKPRCCWATALLLHGP